MLVRSLVRLLVPLSLIAGIPLAVVADTAQPAVSYVSSYNGPASAYHISRSGKSIDVAPLVLLQPGDRVSVVIPSDKLGTKMTITLSINGQHQIVDASRPYCVGASDGICGSSTAQGAGPAGTVATVLQNIFASVAPLFAAAQEDYYSSKVDQMTSRGPPAAPSAPLLHTTPRAGASLNNGSLTIPWLSGRAPFHVRLFLGQSNQPIADKPNVATMRCALNQVLVPGTYRVEIEDSSGAKATGTFDSSLTARYRSFPTTSNRSSSISPRVSAFRCQRECWRKKGRITNGILRHTSNFRQLPIRIPTCSRCGIS